MKPTVSTLAFAAALMTFSLMATPASAQLTHGYGGYGNYGPQWFGNFESPYATGRIPTPPYFALHPPVYYSYAVPRSYGYSPFAYPGTVRTPDVEVAPQSAVIINPHVKQKVKEASSKEDDKVAELLPKSQMIINPFFNNPELKPGVELAKLRK